MIQGHVDTFRALAGQALVAGYPGLDIPSRLVEAVAAGELGGIILFKRNIESAAQVHRALRALAFPEHSPPLIAVDQEGGRVARFRTDVLQLPPMRRLGDHGDVDLTREAAHCLGRHLRSIGFTMDFAPILDVDTHPDNPVIGDRSFGVDPERVSEHALAFALGLEQAGLLACGKHFPGHGDTDLDSHLALPKLAHHRERLDAIELRPFQDSLRIPAIMTAHVVFEAIDPGVPATLSKKVITGLLRNEMGYQGCIISDDLEMKAVADGYGIVPSAIAAIEAGCDLLLVCSDIDACFKAREALATKANADSIFEARLREAAARSLSLRLKAPPHPTETLEFDVPAGLANRLAALTI